MTITLERPDLRSLTPAELAELAAIGAEHNAELAEQVAAEKSRRERVRRMAARRVKMISGEGIYNAEAQYAQARAELNGQLVAHHSKWPDDFALWFGNEATARANATTDLCEWWDRNPRIAAGAFDEQLAAHDRAAREAYEHDRMDRDDSPAVRRERSGSPGSDVPRAGSAGNRRHGGTDRPGGHVTTITGERCMHNDATCTHKSPAGIAARAARRGTGTFGGQATVAVRESAAVVQGRQPLDGAVELGYARKFLGYFAVYPSEAVLDTITLWAAHAHAKDAGGMLVFQSSPRLLFQSKEPGSGKSWAMRLLSRITPSPEVFTEPSEPAVAHAIGKEHATLFLDEADVLFGRGGRKAAIRAVINDGYTPGGSWSRVRNGVVDKIPTFGALALAGLEAMETGTDGHLKALFTRCIKIVMTRGPEGYRPPRFDKEAQFVAAKISERLGTWASQVLGELEDSVPDMPEGIGNRQAELWEPLIAVADAAGGRWPEAARLACEELVFTGGMPDEDAETASEMDRIMAQWDAGTVVSGEDEWA